MTRPSKVFANCEVKYETLIDHNTYEYLRVTIEVPRGQTLKAIVLLRGKPVGELNMVGEDILATRYGKKNKNLGKFKNVGLASATIITDLL